MKKEINFIKITALVLSMLLLAFMAFNAWYLLFSPSEKLLSYLTVASKEPVTTLSHMQQYTLRGLGLLHGLSALILFLGILKLELFKPQKEASLLKWGIYTVILALVFYGGLLRTISNQQGAALLYFAVSLIYLMLSCIHKEHPKATSGTWSVVRQLPIYLMLFYTMGLPGYVKLFQAEAVLPRYNKMFQDSFIAGMPGGTAGMIILMGIFELAVTLLLAIALIRGEFRAHSSKPTFNSALLLAVVTFSMLCFGLLVIGNYQGAINLVFYAIFTFLLMVSTTIEAPQSKHEQV